MGSATVLGRRSQRPVANILHSAWTPNGAGVTPALPQCPSVSMRRLGAKIENEDAGCVSYILPARHFLPGFFEDIAFAGCKAVDAVRGDFFQDGIHFVREKIVIS